MARQHADGLLLSSDALFASRAAQIAILADRYSMPTFHAGPRGTEAGGLVSYSSEHYEVYRQAGRYAGRILKGERPAELPVQEPTRFQLIVNLKTARSLGLTIPLSLQVAADEVIE